MMKFIIAHALVLSIFSSAAFAEGGGDRVFDRNEARAQEALAAQQKTQNGIENTATSDTETVSRGSS